MYGRINRDNIQPMVNPLELREEASVYLRNHLVYTDMRNAYRQGRITKQQLMTLRGQLKAGDVAGAVNGLGNLLYRYECRERDERACT